MVDLNVVIYEDFAAAVPANASIPKMPTSGQPSSRRISCHVCLNADVLLPAPMPGLPPVFSDN
jgi:hypothetical protein